jgi:hypothetical protein
MEENMRDAGRRPMGRLCCWVLVIVTVAGFRLPAWATPAAPQSGPATTTVADTVYLADGTAAQGTMIISWPAFVTASGAAVAAGNTSVSIAANGTFSVALVPNAGATPAGVYYTVVYQLGPGEVKTEYWVVPTTSPANLATVRTTPGSGQAQQPVSMQYVNAQLSTKANDSAVVHLAGTETITGGKTFGTAPSVPTPTSSGQVANKAYVDSSVANVGAGNYLPTVGGTMTGPITLPANPAAALQAATKQYVDTGLAAKADLAAGVVPVNELGTGQATAGSCLLGNGTSSGTWGACGGGSGTGNLSTTPVASQTIAQPEGTQFSTNNLANIRYVTANWNWAQTPADDLTTAGNHTIHLSPCPLGLDTASSANNYIYRVYIAGIGTPEAVTVTGGSCPPGTSSGTITVTTAYAHGAGYTVGSASTGIQEAWNDAWVNDNGGAPNGASVPGPYVKLVANTQYSVYSSVYLRAYGGTLDGTGALIVCSTRNKCINSGLDYSFGHEVQYHKLVGLVGSSTIAVDGANVSNVSASAGTYTVTTAAAHPFVAGDTVDCEYHTQGRDEHWMSQVLSAGLTSTQFEVQFGSATFSAGANVFGWCNIENAFIEDYSDHDHIEDLQLTLTNPSGLGYFNYGIVNDNDQQLHIEHAGNRGSTVLNPNGNHSTATWPIGAFVYSRQDQSNAGITYLHKAELTNVNCYSGGPGLTVDDTVCQGYPVFGFRYLGGLSPASFSNVYQESSIGIYNGLYSGNLAAAAGYVLQSAQPLKVTGTWPTQSAIPQFANTGSTVVSYFVVPVSNGTKYGSPLFIGSALSSGSGNINLQWPSIRLNDSYSGASVGTLTWDIVKTTGAAVAAPYGSGNAIAVATGVSGNCTYTGMCSYTDPQTSSTPYTVQPQGFFPSFWWWPANYVLNANSVLIADRISASEPIVASQGTLGVSVIAQECDGGGYGITQQRTPVQIECPSSNYLTAATVLRQTNIFGNGQYANHKGLLNFGAAPPNLPNDLVTLADSNLAKTLATAGQQPSNDAGDLALGMDQAGGLNIHAGTSISFNINSVPTGANWLERLTATGKTLNVPLTVNGSLAVSGGTVTLPIVGSGSQCLHVSSTGTLSGTGSDCGSGSGSGSGTVNSGATSQVAMYTGNGTAVSGDGELTDSGATLNYTGSGGISTTSGSFSGNVTVNGQLLVAGPWTVSSPIPGTAMGAAGAGTSALGISNDGNFYISANGGTPQKVATGATSSYFSNLTQEDANDVGEYNGTTAQNLHVYGTYTNSSNFERTGLGWDATDGLFVLKNENAGTGQQRGIGFWIGNNVRWGIDTLSTLKPYTTNSFDIGVFTSTSQFVPRTVYAGTSFDTLTQGRHNFELCNDTTTGTAPNFLAKYNGANPACAVKAGTSDTDGVIGVVSNGSGTSGYAVITYRGYVTCSFDGSTTTGDFVVASTTNAGDCHDAGAARPTGVQVLGRVESTNSGAGTYGIRVSLDAPAATGAAPQASPTFTGTVTLPDGTTDSASGISLALAVALPSGSTATTPAGSDNSTKVATTAYVQNQNYQINTPRSIDASLDAGATLDVKLNTANALAITSGNSTIDARALGGAQTIASQVNIGELVAPAVAAATGTSPGAGTYKLVYTLTSPTASETSASQEATVTVTAAQAIQVSSPAYYGTATSYSVYMTAAGGASWTEAKCAAATGVAMGTPVTISATCSGAAVSLKNSGFAVSLIPPKTGVWTVTIADTVAKASCGLKFFDQSSFEGMSAGEGRSWYLSSTSGTNVEGLACTDPNPKLAGGGYYRITGLAAHGTGSDSIQVAPCVFRLAVDVSNFDDLQCTSYQTYPAASFYGGTNVGVGASTRVSGSFEGSSAACPVLQLGYPAGDTMVSWDFHDMSVVHPGNTTQCSGRTAANIGVIGGINGLKFTGTLYMEGPASGTCGDAIQLATATGQGNAAIDFDTVVHGGYCNGTSAYLFSVPNASYTLGHLAVHSTQTGNFTNLFRYAPNMALNLSGVGTNTTYPEFVMDNNNPETVVTNFQVLGTATLGAGSALASSPATADSSTKMATTAWVNAQGYGTGSGNVSGPGSSVSGDIATFSGTNGKTIQDSGTAVSSLAPLASPVLTGTPMAPTQSAGDNSTKIATTAYVKNEIQLAWTCPVAGATTTGVSYCNWTVPANITITQFDLALSTAPAGCTTYPTLQIWDGKANAEVGSYSVTTTSSGGNFYPVVTGTTNLAAGEYLRVKVTTGGAGCTTSPAGIVATVTYQMQN